MPRQGKPKPGKPPFLPQPPSLARKEVQQTVSNQANQGLPLKKAFQFALDDLQFPTVIRSRILTDTSERGSRPTSTTSQRRRPSRDIAQARRDAPARSRHPAVSQSVKPPNERRKLRVTPNAPVRLTAMVAKITSPSRPVTRSRATTSPDEQSHNEPHGEGPGIDTQESVDSPRAAGKGKNKAAAVKAKAKENQSGQAVKKSQAEPENEPDAATDDQAQPSITVASALDLTSVASRSRRPKAVDFYDTVDTPAEATSESTPLPIDCPPLTPKIPWDLYGINNTATSNPKHELADKTNQNKTRPAKGETKSPEQGISHRNLRDPPLNQKETHHTAAAEDILIPDWPDPDLSLDPHDKLMSEDYIPLSPDAIPHAPQSRKARKAKPRKQRLPPLSTTDVTQPINTPKDPDTPEAAGTPFPSPTSPPLDVQQPQEADAAIWNLGTCPSPVHAVRNEPVRPGSVYCEMCFRDEMARWTRVRDRVVRVLHLLGEDEALRGLRVLGWEAEEAGKVQGTEAPGFGGYPSDVVGLVLLRVLAGRQTAGLGKGEKNEVDGLLEGLREDVGVGPKFLDALTTVCKAMLVRWRTGRDNKGCRSGEDTWWWEFDDTLHAADYHLSATDHPPSCFDRTLKTKAQHLSVAALSAKEAATAQDSLNLYTPHATPATLAELEQTLGLTTPSPLFLKTIGDKLAHAKHHLTSQQPPSPITETTSNTKTKTKRAFPSSPPTPLPPRKRHKPNPSQPTAPQPPSEQPEPNPNPPASPLPLPCTHCSSSAAHHQHTARQRQQQQLQQPWGVGSNPTHPPWLKPLLWSFNLPPSSASRVQSAEEFFHLVATSRHVEVVELVKASGADGNGGGGGGGGVKVMVDGTAGKTRVVVVEMAGIFECVFGRGLRLGLLGFGRDLGRESGVKGLGEEGWAARRVVGRWEVWRRGRLEGFELV